MRERRPLKQDTQLIVRNRTGGSICYIVGKVIGEGGSCLVYEGYYQNNAGTKLLFESKSVILINSTWKEMKMESCLQKTAKKRNNSFSIKTG